MSETGAQPTSPRAHRRRKRWVRGDLQLKIILTVLSVAVVVLALNYQLNLIALGRLCENPPPATGQLLEQASHFLAKHFIISAIVLAMLSIWVGTFFAFKFCGPIYRFRKFFLDYLDQPWGHPCTLRKGDDLQDVKDSINAAMSMIHRRLRIQHELLERSRATLLASLEGTQERREIRKLLDQLEEERIEFQARFAGRVLTPEPETPSEDRSPSQPRELARTPGS